MHPWFLLILILANNWLTAQPAQVSINDLGVTYIFGESMSFKARIFSIDPIKEVFLFIQPEGQDSMAEKMTLSGQGELSYIYDLHQKPLPPFSKITYWYRVVFGDGSQEESGNHVFSYEDNHFTWQNLDQGGFQVYWVEGDLAFGQTALNTAKAGLDTAHKYLPGNPPSPLRIFIYPTSDDLQAALQASQISWIAGHANPQLGIIMVTISPGPEQRMEMERQIPHEIMHLVESQAAGDAYSSLPTWLTEGVASLAEIYPNPDFQRSLSKAAESGTLIPLDLLCNGFSHEASSAFLSYAESISFVRFLSERFGSSGLQTLIKKYQDGLGCSEGLQAAYGQSLDQLDAQWKEEVLGINAQVLAWKNLSPYLLLSLLLLLPPIGLGVWNRGKF
jgi:hypothetical protein